MTSDPYVLLCTRLSVLAAETSATFAAVLDEGGQLYGASDVLDPHELRSLGTLFDDVLASAGRPLHRGGRVHFARSASPPFAMAESFAGIYVLVLLFEDHAVNAHWPRVKRALPEIEALTVSLPPDDPGGGEGAKRVRKR